MNPSNTRPFSPVGDGGSGHSTSQGSGISRLASSPSSHSHKQTTYGNDDNDYDAENPSLSRQRSSSMSIRLRNAGGVNSIDNFARSWQRAAVFPEVNLWGSSYFTSESEYSDGEETPTAFGRREDQPLLGDNSEARDVWPRTAIADYGSDSGLGPSKKPLPNTGLPDIHVASPPEGAYGASYGSVASRISRISSRQPVKAIQEHPPIVAGRDADREPLLVKQIEHEDGTKENVVVGQSTVPQTIFNSVNVLIGVGLLSLPLGIKYAGWLIGLPFLLFAAMATAYTAKVLAKCLDVDRSLVTYADLAYISFGQPARVVTSILFSLELIGACVALVVLFADSLDALIPGLGLLQWKIICGLILIPLNFVPLRLLSVTSVLGIISCTSIVLIVIIDGFLKPRAPGSLLEPARTSLFPDSWATLPLSFGLIMSPWGGHGVFPNIYRDMRHPHKYGKSLRATYFFTYGLDCTMAIIGWLMFGPGVRDEITSNVLLTEGYPRGLSICVVIFIAIIPITKTPLNCRPLIAICEVICGVDSQSESASLHSPSKERIHQTVRIAIRIFLIALIVFIAIVFPAFDRIMALMGSSLCFTICIILPLAFYLKIFGNDIPRGERVLDWVLLVASSAMAVVGTVWAFLPREAMSAN
ncbi:hypothetical protein DTO027B5_3399 [Paecilomyces variotii]|nr:hypothetical protein DTO195F2_3558 [Paecilomyces variotii]KAJ9289094.1 hypothetical protein DTO021C3_3286 [Paecilomyces variotii]KAJ9324964.1 hypothetical protein DTO027B3_4096 [Paecilomyces variotii]KAJ9334893.1 hypothetical protein DTO027B5_3399 [Paecilomyces variotii]